MSSKVVSPLPYDQGYASLRRIKALADIVAAVDIEKIDQDSLEEMAAILGSEAKNATKSFGQLWDNQSQKPTRQPQAEKLPSDA